MESYFGIVRKRALRLECGENSELERVLPEWHSSWLKLDNWQITLSLLQIVAVPYVKSKIDIIYQECLAEELHAEYRSHGEDNIFTDTNSAVALVENSRDAKQWVTTANKSAHECRLYNYRGKIALSNLFQSIYKHFCLNWRKFLLVSYPNILNAIWLLKIAFSVLYLTEKIHFSSPLFQILRINLLLQASATV